MCNHVHWVFETREKDNEGHEVYLEDIMQSVKRGQPTRSIKKRADEGVYGKESFDTTIRDDKHMMNAIRYTLNNPVNAGLISNWDQWPGSYWADHWL